MIFLANANANAFDKAFIIRSGRHLQEHPFEASSRALQVTMCLVCNDDFNISPICSKFVFDHRKTLICFFDHWKTLFLAIFWKWSGEEVKYCHLTLK